MPTSWLWLWSRRLLSSLSSLPSKKFRNQHVLRLSQTFFQRRIISTNTDSATMQDEMDT